MAPEADSQPTPQDGAAANAREDAIQSLEGLGSSGRPLSELLEEAKRLVNASNGEVTACAKSEANEKPRLAEIAQERSGGQLNLRAGLLRSGHFTGSWRRIR